MQKRKAGFTSTELVIVLAILGILAAVAIPAFLGYVRRAKEYESKGIGHQNHRGMSATPAAPAAWQPPAVGKTVLIDSNRLVTVRNPEPVTNVEGGTFRDGEECSVRQDWILESVGADGASTLFRLKAYVNDPERVTWKSECPIGAVFFVGEDDAKRYVVYTVSYEQRQEEARLKGVQESETARRLLEEYRRQHQ